MTKDNILAVCIKVFMKHMKNIYDNLCPCSKLKLFNPTFCALHVENDKHLKFVSRCLSGINLSRRSIQAPCMEGTRKFGR